MTEHVDPTKLTPAQAATELRKLDALLAGAHRAETVAQEWREFGDGLHERIHDSRREYAPALPSNDWNQATDRFFNRCPVEGEFGGLEMRGDNLISSAYTISLTYSREGDKIRAAIADMTEAFGCGDSGKLYKILSDRAEEGPLLEE